MRTNATSGPVCSLYLSIILLVILVSVSDKACSNPLIPFTTREQRNTVRRRFNNYFDPEDGCTAYGHACFGAHGKRIDSTVKRDTLQESISQNFQESEVPSPNDELFYVLPNDKFRERSDQSFMRARKDIQPFDVYSLSFLVDQWVRISTDNQTWDIKTSPDRKWKVLQNKNRKFSNNRKIEDIILAPVKTSYYYRNKKEYLNVYLNGNGQTRTRISSNEACMLYFFR